MSNIKHTACPRCQENGRDRHGDNLAIYPDGSAFCFACSYTVSKSRYLVTNTNKKQQISLPSDLTWEFPLEVTKWVYKYLDRPVILKYRIAYSPYWNQLIFPINENMYIARNFNINKPKWYIRGDKPVDYIIRNVDSDMVILCEDILSGIKICKAGYNAHVLFGTNIPIEGSRKLYNGFSKVRVWLDMDAQKKALKSVLRLQTFFQDVRTISTQHDPKEYNITEIQEIVNGK